MKKCVLVFFAMFLLFASYAKEYKNDTSSNLRLWYDKPANATAKDKPLSWTDDEEWMKALPLGNGSLGVMVFGDVNHERIQLNEESMWSGSPQDSDNPQATEARSKIRELLFAGKYKEAEELTNKTQICIGKGTNRANSKDEPYGSFQTLGDLWIDTKSEESFENYYRELDLNDAVVRVRYSQNGINYKREIFISNPDNVMVAKFTADKPGQLSFTCRVTRPESFNTRSDGNQLVMSGALNDGKGGDGLQYMARLQAVNKNGKVSCNNGELTVENADEVILFLTASTDYVLSYPEYKGRDYKKISGDIIKKASAKQYEELLQSHLKEYQQFFNRVSLDITPDKVIPVPTNERLIAFKKTHSDPHLEELFFQYGRYLLISSSRPGTLPANLVGLWTNKLQSPWNGDYHLNVNLQMNYWPADVTNIAEMNLPLFDLIESLVEPGRKTAQIQYKSKGWVVHPLTNVWGFTSPGEQAGWGAHVVGAAWICTHIFDHYAFSGNKTFLKRMYPVLKEAVEFYLEWLVVNPQTGKLVSGPAGSPENKFYAPDGSISNISMGPAHDQQVIWQLFTDFIKASEILDKDDDTIKKVNVARSNLAGPQIGSDGRLMEWAEEFKEPDPGHRHISHLFALHPGAQINLEQTPEWAEAAKKSLDYRVDHGGGHTGWSAAWLISQYARLQEAEKAKESLNTVLAKSTSLNLFGTHPPFQIDGNLGTTAGIAEMLLQSHAGIIHLLPALPEEWATGEVTGLKARGGFEIDMKWNNNKLTAVKIKSNSGNSFSVKYRNFIKEVKLKKGETVLLNEHFDKYIDG